MDTKQDTGKFRANSKDQFYTDESVAKRCIESILSICPSTRSYLWIEPSAGNGSFLKNTPAGIESTGIDIDPKLEGCVKGDYLKWNPPQTSKKILVFGNPPFGKQSSLAKGFIDRSCKFASVVAFILPKSFTKPSMYNAFDRKFHLIHTKELEKDSFVINGSKYDVPCVFQIWEKRDVDREVEVKVEPQGFQYVKGSEVYDIALRRVGVYAGRCYRGYDFSVQSHYFIKFDEEVVGKLDKIVEKINQHIFPSNTVGPRSLSKGEVNVVLNGIVVE